MDIINIILTYLSTSKNKICINFNFISLYFKTIHMSCWCNSEQPEYKYQVKSLAPNDQGVPHETVKYFNSLDEIDHLVKQNENVGITKVKTQQGLKDLKSQMQKTHQKFTDATFPPEKVSLGDVKGNITWKRIPQLIKNGTPVLFDKKIEPSDVIAGHQGDCYMLSSLAVLAENPEIIQRIFRGQAYNEQGLYKVNLRGDGVVEQVIIDDFIPIHENGLPVYCQPNPKTGQIWVVLLEKALAKLNGGYSDLNEGVPSDIFRMVTHAPSESLIFGDSSQEKQKIWALIKNYTKSHYPFCATSKDSVLNGLQYSHTYTIIAGDQIQGTHGNNRIVKLRNPWNNIEYTGQANSNDHQFWDSLANSQAKTHLQTENNHCDYGLFYMTFEDFCKNFNQIHYCNLNQGGKFLSQPLLLNNKASFFEVSIQREGVYTFELNQSKHWKLTEKENKAKVENQQIKINQVVQHAQGHAEHNLRKENVEHDLHKENVEHDLHKEILEHDLHKEIMEHDLHKENIEHDLHKENVEHADHLKNLGIMHLEENQQNIDDEDDVVRASLLLIRRVKKENGYSYEFVNGTMKYDQNNTTLTEKLPSGDYIIYAKVDPTSKTNRISQSATLNLYSKNFANLQPVLRTKYPSLLRQTFLNHAEHNKRNEYGQGKIWISWQLFFLKGGFAYLAAGNSKDSAQEMIIHFSQEQFHHLNFKLKKPFKGKGNNQVIRIQPGQSEIIIVKVINDPNVKTIKFPPKLDIKLESFRHP